MTFRLFILSCFFNVFFHTVHGQNPFKREMRGVWLTTLMQIDWPKDVKSSNEEKKQEIVNIFNTYKEAGINTVFFQVRPVGDAFYKSNYEALSKYLVGNDVYSDIDEFDPLTFCINEAHKRGMELHAWINPFRMMFNPNHVELQSFLNKSELSERFVLYGNHLYLDPGFPENRKYVLDVIKDIVEHYPVDGIHLDDYFYPYPKGRAFFNDFVSYVTYGSGKSREDWRRANINSFIQSCNLYLKSKNRLAFGVSPFGVWANKSDHKNGSETNAGITSYCDSYADVKLWLEEGWVDYAIPQIYWYIGHPAANYETIIKWWNNIHTNRHLYVGHSIYKFDENSEIPAWTTANEIQKQIELSRSLRNINGSVFYNTSSLRANKVYVTSRIKKMYEDVALPPVMEFKSKVKCQKPKAKAFVRAKELQIKIKANDGANFNYGFLVTKDESGKLKRDYLFTTDNKPTLVHLDLSHFSNTSFCTIEVFSISKTRHVSKPTRILVEYSHGLRIKSVD